MVSPECEHKYSFYKKVIQYIARCSDDREYEHPNVVLPNENGEQCNHQNHGKPQNHGRQELQSA